MSEKISLNLSRIEKKNYSKLGYISPLITLIVWQLISWLKLVESTLLPDPINIGISLFRLLISDGILVDLVYSLARTLVGFSAAAIVGVLIGLLIGAIRPLYSFSIPMIDFFRSTPITTLYPVFVLTLGISHASKIGMIFVACVFVIALNTAYGVIQSNKARRQMASLYGASRANVFKWIIFFESLPQTIIGLRISISLAWIVSILCEMFMGSQYGVGQRLIEAFTTYSMADMFAIIIMNGVIGLVLNRLIVILEKGVVPWKASTTQ